MSLCFPLLLLISGICVLQAANEVKKVSLPLIPELQRAELYVLKLTEHPAAILVLSPGFNENGRGWIEKPAWQKFARDYNLDLVALSFASDGELLQKGRGYYYPSQGSGQLLLDGIDNNIGPGLPLLLYGFSGGAHFTSGFVEWKPERVKGWCAYSAEWWSKPSRNPVSPPGLIACGDEDDRNGESLLFFKQGRALGKPWLWISVNKTGHALSSPLEDFVRHYFASILEAKDTTPSGRWVDIDLKTDAAQDTLANQPSLTGWLPDPKLMPEWQTLHQP